MTRQEFEATEGLLHDVMRKQAGTVEKAILEAVMNSVDAGAENIEVTIEEDSITIEDDGSGMSEEEIDEYFRKFGLKDDDIEDKEFGKFRMGRGQIFNFGVNIWKSLNNILLVNLDDGTTEIPKEGVVGYENDDDVHVHSESLLANTEGLGYNLLESEESVDGCSIEVRLYNEIDDIHQLESEVKNLVKYIPWVHGVKLSINEKTIDDEFTPHMETPLGWYYVNTGNVRSSTKVFNKGAFVKSERITRTSGVIITKEDLDVNFARNDILSTDDNWSTIVKEYEQLTVDKLLDSDNNSSMEMSWIVEKAGDDDEILEQVRHEKIVKDVSGELHSLQELSGEAVSFAPEGDKLAQSAMEQADVLVLSDMYEDAIKNSGIYSDSKPLHEVIEENIKWEMDEVSINSLKKKQITNLERVRYLLDEVGYMGRVKPANSAHSDVWKDDEGVLFLDRSFLKQNKDTFLTEGLIRVLEVAAIDEDTRTKETHSIGSRRNFHNYVRDMGEAQRKLLSGKEP